MTPWTALADRLAAVLGAAVAQLDRLERTGRCAAGHGRAAQDAVVEHDLYLDASGLPRESRICLAWMASMEDKKTPDDAAMTCQHWSLVERPAALAQATPGTGGLRQLRRSAIPADRVHMRRLVSRIMPR